MALLLLIFSHSTLGSILVNGPCVKEESSECPYNTLCQEEAITGEYLCLHKPLFPLNSWDYLAVLLVILSCALAAGGGVGGGGLLVPIYLLVLNFETNQATSLSLATISGGSVANFFTYIQRFHPNPMLTRPLIDYDASLLFGPPLLAGTMIGSLFSVIFPEWLVVICLVLLLSQSSYKTLKKGISKWRSDGEDWTQLGGDINVGNVSNNDETEEDQEKSMIPLFGTAVPAITINQDGASSIESTLSFEGSIDDSLDSESIQLNSRQSGHSGVTDNVDNYSQSAPGRGGLSRTLAAGVARSAEQLAFSPPRQPTPDSRPSKTATGRSNFSGQYSRMHDQTVDPRLRALYYEVGYLATT